MYKEFRDTTLNGAISQMCKDYQILNPSDIDQDMKGKHRAPHESIQVIKTSIVPNKDAIREATRVYSKTSLKFPRVKPLKRAPTVALRTTFKARRPQLLWAKIREKERSRINWILFQVRVS